MENVQVNGQILTESQFEEKKEEVAKQKGVTLIEVSPGVYKTKLED